jgi:two-component system cell cycle sensor histidine kinase/response regulator CckA
MPRSPSLRSSLRSWEFSRKQELPLLHRVARIVTGEKNLEKACGRVAAAVAAVVHCDVVTIERYDAKRKSVELLGVHGIPHARRKSTMAMPLGLSMSAQAVRTGAPSVRHTALTARGSAPSLVRTLKLRTVAAVPLKSHRTCIGAICLGSRELREVSPDFLRVLTLLATTVAWHIERRGIEESMRACEERYRVLFQDALDPILIVDPATGHILDANPQTCALTGYAHKEILGKTVSMLHPPDEAPWHKDVARSTRTKRTATQHPTVHILHRSGKRVPVEIKARLVGGGPGALIVAIARDLTEQTRAEVKMTASEELLRIIVEGTQDLFFFVQDTSGTFTYVSPSVKKITGYGTKEWKDHYAKFLTPSPVNDLVRKHTEEALTKGTVPPAFLGEIRRVDGETILLEINERPVFKEGNVIGVQGVARDITERKRLEDRIMESREYLNRILEQTPIAVMVFTPGGDLVDVNEAFLRLFGASDKDTILGKVNIFESAFARKANLRGYLDAAFRGEVVDIPSIDVDPRTAEPGLAMAGNERTVRVKMFPVVDRNGVIVNVVAMLEDVSDRRRLEEQLMQSQKMESIGLLAGGIAHDFNNILGGILGYASYLKLTVNKDAREYTHIETIERSALRAADLTSQLLAFARGGKYVVRPVNINELIEETVHLLRGSIDKNIYIETRFDTSMPVVEADASQMQQVVMNLCVNARDAMPKGGVLTIGTSRLRRPDPFLLSQPDARKSGYARIAVTDTGVGIDKPIRGRIFEPFFTTKEKGKGTGLGLATVYGIVKNHGGLLHFESEVGKGTTFYVYLPTVEKVATSVQLVPERASGGSETILIVDDEETIRSLVKDILEMKGYKVLAAADGREAIDVYRQERGRIDLVILDMAMPGMDGRETFEELKTINPQVKAILSTGFAEDDRAREVMALGVKAFVQKPYRIDDLAGAVRRVLDIRNGE